MKNILIILTSTIGRMGGAQMYVENKVNYFQSKGWDVYVFYYLWADNILLPGMAQFKDNYIPDLQYPIQYLPMLRRREIIKRIRNIVQPDNSTVIIESQLTGTVYWGELLAKDFGGRNIMNLLEEQLPLLSDKENEFFAFKLERNEFLNATPNRIKRLFAARFKEEQLMYARQVAIPCANVVAPDIEDNYLFDECDYMILSIGRLDKPYIETMNEEVIKFGADNKDKTINMVYVGGSHNGSKEKEIPRLFEDISNINCYVLGYVFPISRSLIKKANVAIACANSVLVSSKEGIPTIVVDIDDQKAIGVYGYTTSSIFKRTTEKAESISILLKKVLVERIFDGKEPLKNELPDADKAFEEDSKYYLDCKEKQYFDVLAIYPAAVKIKSKAKYIIRKILQKK